MLRRLLILLPLLGAPVAAQNVPAAVTAGVVHIDVPRLRALSDSLRAAGKQTAQLGGRDGFTYALTQRDSSGTPELHGAWTDLFIVERGSAVVQYGGAVPDARETTPGELRAKVMTGGTRATLHEGDLFIIPAGTWHQMHLLPGEHIVYMAFKLPAA